MNGPPKAIGTADAADSPPTSQSLVTSGVDFVIIILDPDWVANQHLCVMNHTFQEHSHSAPHRLLLTFDLLFNLRFNFELLPNLRILQDAPSPSAPTRDLSCRSPRVT